MLCLVNIPKKPLMEIDDRKAIGTKLNAVFKTLKVLEKKPDKTEVEQKRLEVIKLVSISYCHLTTCADFIIIVTADVLRIKGLDYS